MAIKTLVQGMFAKSTYGITGLDSTYKSATLNAAYIC